MKGVYQAPTLQPAGTFQEVTEGHGYGGYGKKKWGKKFFGYGFGHGKKYRKFGYHD